MARSPAMVLAVALVFLPAILVGAQGDIHHHLPSISNQFWSIRRQDRRSLQQTQAASFPYSACQASQDTSPLRLTLQDGEAGQACFQVQKELLTACAKDASASPCCKAGLHKLELDIGVGCAGAVSGVTINGHAWSDTEVVYPASGKAMLRVSNIGATQEEAIGLVICLQLRQPCASLSQLCGRSDGACAYALSSSPLSPDEATCCPAGLLSVAQPASTPVRSSQPATVSPPKEPSCEVQVALVGGSDLQPYTSVMCDNLAVSLGDTYLSGIKMAQPFSCQNVTKSSMVVSGSLVTADDDKTLTDSLMTNHALAAALLLQYKATCDTRLVYVSSCGGKATLSLNCTTTTPTLTSSRSPSTPIYKPIDSLHTPTTDVPDSSGSSDTTQGGQPGKPLVVQRTEGGNGPAADFPEARATSKPAITQIFKQWGPGSEAPVLDDAPTETPTVPGLPTADFPEARVVNKPVITQIFKPVQAPEPDGGPMEPYPIAESGAKCNATVTLRGPDKSSFAGAACDLFMSYVLNVYMSPYNPNVLPSCMIDSSEPGSMVGDTLVVTLTSLRQEDSDALLRTATSKSYLGLLTYMWEMGCGLTGVKLTAVSSCAPVTGVETRPDPCVPQSPAGLPKPPPMLPQPDTPQYCPVVISIQQSYKGGASDFTQDTCATLTDALGDIMWPAGVKPPTWACLFQDPSTVVVSTVLGNTLQATALLTRFKNMTAAREVMYRVNATECRDQMRVVSACVTQPVEYRNWCAPSPPAVTTYPAPNGPAPSPVHPTTTPCDVTVRVDSPHGYIWQQPDTCEALAAFATHVWLKPLKLGHPMPLFECKGYNDESMSAKATLPSPDACKGFRSLFKDPAGVRLLKATLDLECGDSVTGSTPSVGSDIVFGASELCPSPPQDDTCPVYLSIVKARGGAFTQATCDQFASFIQRVFLRQYNNITLPDDAQSPIPSQGPPVCTLVTSGSMEVRVVLQGGDLSNAALIASVQNKANRELLSLAAGLTCHDVLVVDSRVCGGYFYFDDGAMCPPTLTSPPPVHPKHLPPSPPQSHKPSPPLAPPATLTICNLTIQAYRAGCGCKVPSYLPYNCDHLSMFANLLYLNNIPTLQPGDVGQGVVSAFSCSYVSNHTIIVSARVQGRLSEAQYTRNFKDADTAAVAGSAFSLQCGDYLRSTSTCGDVITFGSLFCPRVSALPHVSASAVKALAAAGTRR